MEIVHGARLRHLEAVEDEVELGGGNGTRRTWQMIEAVVVSVEVNQHTLREEVAELGDKDLVVAVGVEALEDATDVL